MFYKKKIHSWANLILDREREIIKCDENKLRVKDSKISGEEKLE